MNSADGSAGTGDKHERQSVACDVALIVYDEAQLKILLIRRKHPPFQDKWALPGGFLDRGETLAEAAAREVEEETGIQRPRLHEIGAFGDPGRDPRGRVISVGFLALARFARLRPRPGDDAGAVGFFPLRKPPELAFDHGKIILAARRRLRELAVLTPDLLDLLPRRISGGDLRQLCREVMGRRYDAETFERQLGLIPALELIETVPGDRLYRFNRQESRPGEFAFLIRNE